MPDVSVHVAEPVNPGDVPGVDRGPGNALTSQTVPDLRCLRGLDVGAGIVMGSLN